MESSTRRIAMRLAYDGTDFLGWQRQATGRTVQEELETRLSRLAGDRPVSVTGAGRTDTGVHASWQVAHADIDSRLDDGELLHALGRMCPPDLAVLELATVDPAFHARYSARRRGYTYRIVTRRDPFRARYALQLEGHIDTDRLDRAADLLCGTHDFTTLSKHNPGTLNPTCTVFNATWTSVGDELRFEIAADRFLYGMVRLVVGLQLDVARGRREPEEIPPLLDARDRARQSPAVPAHGLALSSVLYDNAIVLPPSLRHLQLANAHERLVR